MIKNAKLRTDLGIGLKSLNFAISRRLFFITLQINKIPYICAVNKIIGKSGYTNFVLSLG